MKKSLIFAACAVGISLTSCGTLAGSGSTSGAESALGSVLGAATNGATWGNILTSVLGTDKPSAQQLVGTWRYREPGVAFTTDNLLAKAGGEVAATTAKQKLTAYYNQVGISAANTQMLFNTDQTFTAVVAGKKLSGTYTYDASNGLLTLKTLLFSVPCYVKRTSGGMSFLFESKKLLSLLQTVAALSGNSTLSTIGDLSKNYDGIRLGFDMNR